MIAFVQVVAASDASPVVEKVVTITATEGNSLIVLASASNAITSVTDNGGNTYELVDTQRYIAKNINGGTLTITMTFSGTTFAPKMRVLEFSGITDFDVGQSKNGTIVSGLNNLSFSVTNTVQPALLLYWEVYSFTAGSQTWDSSYTLAFSSGVERIYYKTVSTTGTQTYAKTMTTSPFPGVGYSAYLASFYYVTPPKCVKLRGQCKLRAKVKIR